MKLHHKHTYLVAALMIVVPVACLDVDVEVRGSPVALAATCGDAVLDPGEQCDDGNTSNGDFCASDCLSGIDATGVNCSETAVQALLDTAIPTGAAVGAGRVITLPNNAAIRVCDQDADGVSLHLNARAIVNGNGAELRVPVPPHADAPTDLTGLRIETAAGYSSIRDLTVRHLITSGQEHAGVGIDINAGEVRLDNIFIDNTGTGIILESGPGINVNGGSWRNIAVRGCTHYGVYINGGDSNGGLFEHILVKNCLNAAGTAVAVYESSYLGNAHVGHLIEGNDVGLVVEGSANRSTFTGVYIEGSDDLQATDAAQATAVGGLLSARRDGSFIGDRVGGRTSRIMFSDPDTTGHEITVTIPFGQDDSMIHWQRNPWGELCTSSSTCPEHDTCELYHPGSGQYRCLTAGGRNKWSIRHNNTPDPTSELRWDVINYANVATAYSFSVQASETTGYFTEGRVGVGAEPLCDYVATCGP